MRPDKEFLVQLYRTKNCIIQIPFNGIIKRNKLCLDGGVVGIWFFKALK